MRGAIFYSGKYGNTERYAKWLSEANGLLVFNIKDPDVDPARYKYVILGRSIHYFKLTTRKWARTNLIKLGGRAKSCFQL